MFYHLRFNHLCCVLLLICLVCVPVGTLCAQKERLTKAVEEIEPQSWEMALAIWNYAEPGYLEEQSSKLLSGFLEERGFKLQRGVAGIPTAFTATFGQGKPVIGILGEFDALPGLSQQAVPFRQPRDDKNSYGHACGHHVFGVASATAAVALAEQIQSKQISGTVRFYGCPAEEGGSAKVFLVRAGLFADCDAALHWHPGAENSAGDRSTLARMAVKFRFKGRAAHASGSPEKGRSALDAVELTNFAAELMREHTPDSTRIHYVITAGGEAPNVVPEFAEVLYYIRHPRSEVLVSLYERLVKCARAGALATETSLEIDFQGGIVELLPNNVLSRVTMANLMALNDVEYTLAETQFALKLQESFEERPPLSDISRVFDRSGTTGKGSTDVGDVSWVVPTTGFSTVCWVPGTPAHSWQAVACGGTTIARQGMTLAAKVLAASAWDMFANPQILRDAQAEHQRVLGIRQYHSLMPAGQKPPLDYRKPSRPPR